MARGKAITTWTADEDATRLKLIALRAGMTVGDYILAAINNKLIAGGEQPLRKVAGPPGRPRRGT